MRISGFNIRRMQRALFIIHFSFIYCLLLSSQNIHLIKEYADEQYERGNFSVAIKEYQRVMLFDNENLFDGIYYKLATIYYETGDFDHALVNFDFAWKATQNDSMKLELAFKKTLCYYKLQKYFLGLTELYDLPDQLPPYFERKKNLYFAICHFGLNDIHQSLQYFAEIVDSAGYGQIDSCFVELNKYQKKYDPDKLEMMSIFIPGLGQTVAGDLESGLNSLLLLSGITAYSYFTMISYGILDGTLVLTTWFYRYYTGGHRKAYELGAQKIQEKKKITYLQVLDVVKRNSMN